MKNLRNKGLAFVREVKSILQSLGHETEGPAYGLIYSERITPRGDKVTVPVQCHRDFFGCFDLISWDPKTKRFSFHQVSIDEERSRKIKNIIERGKRGNVWGRAKQGRSIIYRTYFVQDNGEVAEGETYFLNEIKKVMKKDNNG